MSNFLLNSAKFCLARTGFFLSFLVAWKSGFSFLFLLYFQQSFVLCIVCAPLCLLHRSQCIAVQAFLGTLAVGLVPGCFLPCSPLVEALLDDSVLAFSWVQMCSIASRDVRSKCMSNDVMPFFHGDCIGPAIELDTSKALDSPVQPPRMFLGLVVALALGLL